MLFTDIDLAESFSFPAHDWIPCHWQWLAPGSSGKYVFLSWHQDHFLGESLWTLANSFGLLPRDWVYTSLNEAGI